MKERIRITSFIFIIIAMCVSFSLFYDLAAAESPGYVAAMGTIEPPQVSGDEQKPVVADARFE